MVVFVSPHLDDVALSCGGLVHRLTKGGQPVTIATICTADCPEDQPLSPIAQLLHQRWGLGERPYAHRRAEDERACQLLGARCVHLGLRDAIYRCDSDGTPLYGEGPIGGPVHPYDQQVFLPRARAALAELLTAADEVVCPLAIGGHVDHLLVRWAVESLRLLSKLRYYEDYPYAERDFAPPADLVPEVVLLTEEEVGARLRAIACYASQWPVLFDTLDAMEARVRAYSQRVGGERYWLNKNMHL
jgi:LmbE family N-acetylglucosaminyl deacetylase